MRWELAKGESGEVSPETCTLRERKERWEMFFLC